MRLSNVHKALLPYIERCIADAQSGIPTMRPDFYDAVDYSESRDPYSYFFGPDLYVCPVIRRMASNRKVHLPKGMWVHFWSGKLYTGGEAHIVPAPLGEIPVFYRVRSDYIELFRETGAKYNLLGRNK